MRMTSRAILPLCLVFCWTAPLFGQPMETVEQPPAAEFRQPAPFATTGVVVNYWQLVQDMMRRIENAPPRENSIGTGHKKPTLDYPFETFRQLQARDLFRAAKEGAQEARRLGRGLPKEVVERRVWANVSVAFEYLPLLVREERDAAELASYMTDRDVDPAIRRYLVRQMLPDQPARSYLAGFMDDAFNRFYEVFKPAVERMAALPTEVPDIQFEAIRTLHTRLWWNYERAYAEDPLVKARVDASGAPEAPAEQLALYPPPIQPATADDLTSKAAIMGIFAESIMAHIRPDSVRDERVKEEVRRVLQHMLDNVNLPNRANVIKLLHPEQAEAVPEELPSFLEGLNLEELQKSAVEVPGLVELPEGL